MASYDSPGWVDRTPGGPVVQGTGAPGSAPGPFPATDSVPGSLAAGTSPTSAVVTPYAGSLVNADRVPVGPRDTLAGSQADQYGPSPDPLTGIGAELGQTGAGMGSGHTVHPNSTNRP